MARTPNLENLQAFADRRIRDTIYPSIYRRCPLMAMMVGMGGNESNLSRPGVMGILSGAKVPAFRRESVNGSVYEDIEILTAKSGGGRTRGPRDTNPAVEQSQDQNLGSARFYWWFYTQPLKVWRITMKLSAGRYRIQNALVKAVDMARDEAVDVISQRLWTGSPSTYNVQSGADLYDDLPSILDVMSSTNAYGNIDRSDTSQYVDGRHPWAGNRTTDARVATIDLVDEANDVCQVYGDGVKIALTTRAIYRKLKVEARAKGAQIYVNGQVPGYGMVGYRKEMIQYGECMITFDPFAPTGHMALFTPEDWVIEIHGEDKFVTDGWEYNGKPGADAAWTANLNVGLRPICTRPVNQFLFTNVQTA